MAVSKTLLTQVSAPLGIFNLPVASSGSQPVIKTTFDALDTTVTGLSSDVGTLQTDVGAVVTQVTTNTNDISTISGDVSTLNTTVSGLETDVSSLTSQVTDNTNNITTIDGNVDTLITQVAGLSTDVGTLQTDVTSIQGDISTLQSEVAAIKAPFTASYAYDAAVWSTAAGIATMTLTNSEHSLGTSRMSDFSIVVTEASGTLEADEDITSLGKVKRASNGTVTFEIDESYLVSTFNTYVAVFA